MSTDIVSMFASIKPRYPELKGRVALVTGSSKGIGKGIALRLAAEGMKVIINARHAEAVQKTAEEFTKLGANVLPVSADVGQPAEIKRLFEEIQCAFGTLDLLVNNAADMRQVHFLTTEESVLDAQLAANIKGPFLLSQQAARMMKEKGRGVIVQISSVGGLRGHAHGLPYDATKGALDSMTRVMGIELAECGIRVNAIAPGAIYTENRLPLNDPRLQSYAQLIPLRRLGLPLEIGAAVAFLASDEASYIIGQTIYVDGGITSQLSPSQYPI